LFTLSQIFCDVISLSTSTLFYSTAIVYYFMRSKAITGIILTLMLDAAMAAPDDVEVVEEGSLPWIWFIFIAFVIVIVFSIVPMEMATEDSTEPADPDEELGILVHENQNQTDLLNTGFNTAFNPALDSAFCPVIPPPQNNNDTPPLTLPLMTDDDMSNDPLVSPARDRLRVPDSPLKCLHKQNRGLAYK